MDDHSELLTYRVTPLSFNTSRPNCLWTSGEPFPNDSASETVADAGRVASLAGPTTGDPWPGLPVPMLARLRPGPKRPLIAWSSLGDAMPPSGEFAALFGWRTDSTSIWPLNSSTMPSSLRRRFMSSNSRSLDGCFVGALGSFGRGRRGARPGAGKMQGIWARRQLEHGMCLSQRTWAG
jgi:hypothetical protein